MRRRLRSHALSLAAAGVVASIALAGGWSGGGASASVVNPGWVRDTTTSLDIFAPDEATDYYFDGYGTMAGARTVISGRVPSARYWSFTIYSSEHHLHDTQIRTTHGRYTITIAQSCTGRVGNCLATDTPTSGIVLMRLYVPVDLHGAGTGGVPLPSIAYRDRAGAPITLDQATGSDAIGNLLTASQAKEGTLPPLLTATYPLATSVASPSPHEPVVTLGGQGAYANPDNKYQKASFSLDNGDLVVKAEAPTYQTDGFHHANSLERTASQDPQTRYWSVCVQYPDRYTGHCLRDEQVKIGSHDRFTIVIAPTCPVAGYANCIPSGPVALAKGILYRNMLPSKKFAQNLFTGPYSLTATYIPRP